MFGTIVNVFAVLLGAVCGVFFGKGLKEKYKKVLNQAMGLAVVFVGASGAIGAMLAKGANPVLFIVALALGGVLGQLAGIEEKMGKLGLVLQQKFAKKQANGNFAQGFVAASLIFCIGTMAVLGPIESGIKGQHDILLAKSVIDGITAMVLASSFGFGVAFSALSVFLYQGSLTVLALWASQYLTASMLSELAVVGGIMIFAIGLNMLEITKIKVANFLPALALPLIYYFAIALL